MSERFWKILAAVVLGIVASATLIILIFQDRCNSGTVPDNKMPSNSAQPNGNKNATDSNSNRPPDNNNNTDSGNKPDTNTSDLAANKPDDPNDDPNDDDSDDSKRDGKASGGSGGDGIVRSYSVEAVQTVVSVNNEELIEGGRKSGLKNTFTVKIMPIGKAKVELVCEEIQFPGRKTDEIQFSARKGEDAEFTNDVIGKSIRLIRGVVSVLANCRAKTQIIAGTQTFYPNGTLYTVAYFPDSRDISKDKTMLVVFEKSVSVENQSTIDSQDKINTPVAPVKDGQFMIFSENTIGNFENDKAYSFKDYNYEEMKDVYKAFEMEKWIPQVLEFYEEKRGKRTANDNEKMFPLPTPIASPSALDWEDTRIVSEHLLIENPIETPLNLILAPPCIQQKTAESCENSNLKWERKGSELRYRFEGDDGIFDIDFTQQCKEFTKEKSCHVILGYEPKRITDLTDLKIIFNHNAEKDGKLEIPLNIKIIPEAKFNVQPRYLFQGKELNIGESETESVDITANDKIKIVRTGIVDANGKASENYRVKESTCIESSLLEKGEKCRIIVEFAPKTEGEHTEQLIIRDEYSGRQVTLLYGEGKKSGITSGITSGIANVKISSDKLNFSPQLINTESVFQEFTVTVDGSNPVEIGKTALNGLGNYRFEDNCSGKIIDSSLPCSIRIFFTPKNVKIQKEVIKLPIKILSTDKKEVLAEETKSVELSGISIIIPNQVCFTERQQKVKLDSSKPRKTETVEIEKVGDTSGIIKSIEIFSDAGLKAKSDDFLLVDENCKGKFGDKCSIKIGFTPRKKKIRSGILLIKFDNSAEPIKIPISGTGKPRNVFCRIIFKLRNKKLKPC